MRLGTDNATSTGNSMGSSKNSRIIGRSEREEKDSVVSSVLGKRERERCGRLGDDDAGRRNDHPAAKRGRDIHISGN